MWPLKPKDNGVLAATLSDQGDGRFSLDGELSFASVPGLLRQGACLFAGSGTIELDLSGVRRADSAGLALLVEWLSNAKRLGRLLSFRHVPEQILRMAEVGGLAHILPLNC